MQPSPYQVANLNSIAGYLTHNISTENGAFSHLGSTTICTAWRNTAKHYLKSVLPRVSLQYGHDNDLRLFARADLEDIEKRLKDVVEFLNSSAPRNVATLVSSSWSSHMRLLLLKCSAC